MHLSAVFSDFYDLLLSRLKIYRLSAISIMCLFACMCSVSVAQNANPGSYADQNNPLGPPGLVKPASIWSVDMASGALQIRIPITTAPASGRGPHIPYIFKYNSSSTVTLSAPQPFTIALGNSGTTTQTTWVYNWVSQSTAPQSQSGNPLGPWTVTYGSSFFITETTGLYYSPYGTSGVPPTECGFFGPYLYADSNGQIHDLNLAGTIVLSQTQGGPPCPLAAANTTSSGTNDGSLIKSSITGFAPAGELGIGAGNPGTLQPVLYPDGTSDSRGKIEDSNGNFAILQSGNWLDSEGRSIASTALGIGSNDVSPGAYSLTIGNATYTVDVATISPSWQLPLSHPTTSEVTVSNGGNTSGYAIQANLGKLYVISQIGLPDSTQYAFSYDPKYGTVSEIDFPQGGHVRFSWTVRSIGARVQGSNRVTAESTLVVSDVYLSDGKTAENHWHYDYSDMDLNTGVLVTKESAPDGTTTTYTNTPYGYSNLFSDTVDTYQETLRQISDISGSPLRSIATSYVGTKPLQIVTTYLDANLQQQINYQYDQYQNEIEKDESAFYSCGTPTACTSSPPLLRKTLTQYYWTTHPDYVSAYIVDEPSQVTITDGAGNYLSQTQYSYDDFSLTGTTGYSNHDDQQYPLSRQTTRGNLTQIKRCASISSGSCSQWLITQYTYDIAGQRVSETDPNGHTTSYSYGDQYVGESCVINGNPCQTDGYLTHAIYTTGASDNYTYYYQTGNIASHSNWNNQNTQYSYADPFNRLTETTYPDGGNLTISYVDASSSPSITTSRASGEADGAIVKETLFDGLDREIETQLISDQFGADSIVTTYDGMGRIASISNPYRTTNSTYGITSFTYDSLGRKLLQCQPDNGTSSNSCTPGSSYLKWSYSGNQISFRDEVGNQSTRTSDALGRLTNVTEPGGLQTAYTYDALGNLVNATQTGGAGETPRSRSFVYDSLSRLTSATNPETGTIGYSYDANGNVLTKTDARGATTTYTYDALNRLLSKTYSGPNTAATASSCYQYDTSSANPGGGNFIGRLTNEWTQLGSCPATLPTTGVITRRSLLSYDAMGRILSEQQCHLSSCTTGGPYNITTGYDLAGNLNLYSNGVHSITLTNSYDGAGRLKGIDSSWADSLHPATLFSVGAYTSAGGIQAMTLGTQLNVNNTYDPRLRITGSIATNVK